jgi:hypothetical protein
MVLIRKVGSTMASWVRNTHQRSLHKPVYELRPGGDVSRESLSAGVFTSAMTSLRKAPPRTLCIIPRHEAIKGVCGLPGSILAAETGRVARDICVFEGFDVCSER